MRPIGTLDNRIEQQIKTQFEGDLHAQERVIVCIYSYSAATGVAETVLKAVYRIANLVLYLIGQNDWQRAHKAIQAFCQNQLSHVAQKDQSNCKELQKATEETFELWIKQQNSKQFEEVQTPLKRYLESIGNPENTPHPSSPLTHSHRGPGDPNIDTSSPQQGLPSSLKEADDDSQKKEDSKTAATLFPITNGDELRENETIGTKNLARIREIFVEKYRLIPADEKRIFFIDDIMSKLEDIASSIKETAPIPDVLIREVVHSVYLEPFCLFLIEADDPLSLDGITRRLQEHFYYVREAIHPDQFDESIDSDINILRLPLCTTKKHAKQIVLERKIIELSNPLLYEDLTDPEVVEQAAIELTHAIPRGDPDFNGALFRVMCNIIRDSLNNFLVSHNHISHHELLKWKKACLIFEGGKELFEEDLILVMINHIFNVTLQETAQFEESDEWKSYVESQLEPFEEHTNTGKYRQTLLNQFAEQQNSPPNIEDLSLYEGLSNDEMAAAVGEKMRLNDGEFPDRYKASMKYLVYHRFELALYSEEFVTEEELNEWKNVEDLWHGNELFFEKSLIPLVTGRVIDSCKRYVRDFGTHQAWNDFLDEKLVPLKPYVEIDLTKEQLLTEYPPSFFVIQTLSKPARYEGLSNEALVRKLKDDLALAYPKESDEYKDVYGQIATRLVDAMFSEFIKDKEYFSAEEIGKWKNLCLYFDGGEEKFNNELLPKLVKHLRKKCLKQEKQIENEAEWEAFILFHLDPLKEFMDITEEIMRLKELFIPRYSDEEFFPEVASQSPSPIGSEEYYGVEEY